MKFRHYPLAILPIAFLLGWQNLPVLGFSFIISDGAYRGERIRTLDRGWESVVTLKDGECTLRDALTHKLEITTLTLPVLKLFWSRGRAKLAIGLAKGKKQHDKRASERERDWQREKQRLLKQR